MRRLRPLLFLALALLGFAAAPATAAATREFSGTVTWVYDGDTLEVSGVGKVRLLGIDTPEHDRSDRDKNYRRLGANPRRLRAAGREARIFNIRLAKGQMVRLVTDREVRDRYGRLLAYVFLPDGRLLNRLLLDEGLAVVYRRFDIARKSEFLAAEETAHARRKGFWAP
jgi:micrococcal nuclease